ncbi:phage antirepressor KilAC domain-containing protein [Pandoraea sputorum]|uniref:phage antirepressor KilAC domain-containing protein n=1 Tax=Pandoraea sputorum TaxID=93222 RepID=UPI002F91A4A8
MSELIIGSAELRMTSQEIAELVEKRHDNVKRTVETLVNHGVIESPQIEEIPTATRPATVYVFTGERGKRDSIVVVAQLSPHFTARLVDRWQELESGAFALPKTLPEALRLAADMAEQKAKVEAALAVATPKADALDRIATAEGSHCIRDSAKVLQLRPIDLTRWLQANHWIYRRAGCGPWLGYQDKIQLGYLEHKVTIVTRSDGSDKVTEQVRITPMGLTRLSARISDEVSVGSQVSPGGKRRITRPAYRPSAI